MQLSPRWRCSPKAFLPTHATAAIQGFIQRLTQNTGYCARLSSARTANILINTPYKPDDINLKTSGTATEDYQWQREMTYWGPALRLRARLSLSTSQWPCWLVAPPPWQHYCAAASITPPNWRETYCVRENFSSPWRYYRNLMTL